jgi:hypothetical protein
MTNDEGMTKPESSTYSWSRGMGSSFGIDQYSSFVLRFSRFGINRFLNKIVEVTT